MGTEYEEERFPVQVVYEFFTTRTKAAGSHMDAALRTEEVIEAAALKAIEGSETNLDRWLRQGAPVTAEALAAIKAFVVKWVSAELQWYVDDYEIYDNGGCRPDAENNLFSGLILAARSNDVAAMVLALRAIASIREDEGYGTPDSIVDICEEHLHAGIVEDLWIENLWGSDCWIRMALGRLAYGN